VNVAIREARPDDAETLFAIQKAASLAAFADVYPPDRYPYPDEAILGRWRAVVADPDAAALVAERDGEAVGAAAVRADWLDGFYVVPELWGAGVAPPFHDAAVERIRAYGSERAHLWVLEANPRARRFYERRGWQLNGETRVVPFPPHPLDVGYSLEL
jgi:RimJ/RimL family protein N-acetyltransferase